MGKKYLLIHIPVIHKGYVDFLTANADRISGIYILADDLLEELTESKPDIASLGSGTVKNLLTGMGFQSISILSRQNIEEIKDKELILIQDEISRNLYEQYFKGQNVEWSSVFLRWDQDSVHAETLVDDVSVSKDPFDEEMIREAYKEAKKSSDWWRHVGGVLVKDKTIVIRGYNQGIPSDHTPYQVGAVRDLFKAGEKPEFANYIHAEQKIISEAAKRGISTDETSLYLTHFPCPVCAKLVAQSGIKKLYFSEGSSVLDGKQVLKSAGVTLFVFPNPT